jgi:hypothetical protein
MGIACLILFRPFSETLPLPSAALPASGFVGIISARVLKAPLTAAKMKK